MIQFFILARLLVILPGVRHCVSRAVLGHLTCLGTAFDANQIVQYTPVTIQLLLSLDTVYGAGLHSYSLYVSS